MPNSPQPQQVFLSYSHADREACLALRAALERAGLAVFRDEDAIRAGDRWVQALQAALSACGAFVVLVGSQGVRRWVGAEVEVALMRHLSPQQDAERLAIFPVLLEGAQPEMLPPFLALFQATAWSPASPVPQALLDAVAGHAVRLDSELKFEGCPFLGLAAFQRSALRRMSAPIVSLVQYAALIAPYARCARHRLRCRSRIAGSQEAGPRVCSHDGCAAIKPARGARHEKATGRHLSAPARERCVATMRCDQPLRIRCRAAPATRARPASINA